MGQDTETQNRKGKKHSQVEPRKTNLSEKLSREKGNIGQIILLSLLLFMVHC